MELAPDMSVVDGVRLFGSRIAPVCLSARTLCRKQKPPVLGHGAARKTFCSQQPRRVDPFPLRVVTRHDGDHAGARHCLRLLLLRRRLVGVQYQYMIWDFSTLREFNYL